ncbi:hypothetical protein SDC9_156817 [bioreactor metagenome]|uniref:Uncharacterized protein n=1 Tax=bioreactor metagenome TaxID=1076179 RepID=A0A645F7A3_9ZZZZ
MHAHEYDRQGGGKIVQCFRVAGNTNRKQRLIDENARDADG